MPASTANGFSSLVATTATVDEEGDDFGSSIGLLAVEEQELPRDSGDGDAEDVVVGSNFGGGGRIELDRVKSGVSVDAEWVFSFGSVTRGPFVSVSTTES